MDYEECKRWYDGYDLKTVKEIFSPRSVVSAMMNGESGSYWTQTGSYDALRLYILMNFDGMRDDVVTMMGGGKVPVEVDSYLNTMTDFRGKDDVFTYLIHLGYLSYNWESGQARIPNYEVRNEFEMAIADTQWTEVQKALAQSDHLLDCVLSGDAEAVAHYVEQVHQENTSILAYNNENALACVLTLAFYTARKMYLMIRELPSGKGFADIVMLPHRNVNAPAIVLELKYNGSAESAISQIKRQNYVGVLSSFSGEVVLVGINYDKKKKKHTCQIERMKVATEKSNTKGNTNAERTAILTEQQKRVLEYCKEQPHTALEIFRHLSISKQAKHYKLYVDTLLHAGYLLDTMPESKRDKRYLSKK